MIRKLTVLSLRIFALVLAICTAILTPASAQDDPEPQPASAIEAGGQAIPPLISGEVFAARNAFLRPQLSPDGRTMVLLQMTKSGKSLQLTAIETATGQKVDGINFAVNNLINWVEWIDNDRVLINVLGFQKVNQFVIPMTRLLIAHPRTGKFDYLVKQPRLLSSGDVLHIAEDGSHAIIAHRGDGKLNTPSVYRYEMKPDGDVTKIVEPKNDIYYWSTDDTGVVRLGFGWRRGKVQIYYRDTQDQEFERIARFKPGETEGYFDALEVINGSSQGYVLDEGKDGRVGLRVFDYKTREIVDTFYENPDWDIERAWLRDGKPLAAFYTDDREQIVWFDEEAKSDYAKLQAAVGEREVALQDWSKDRKKMLAWAGSEADPGVLYFFDVETGAMQEIKAYRPSVDPRLLARPKAVSYTARDGTLIRGYLTLPQGRDPKDLPLIIHPHGGPYGIRDTLQYDDWVQFLANRGYAVLQPNFRGSGGYGSDFYDLGNGEIGRGMQDDLDDAMDWAVAEGIADASRVCIVGASYGGYAALWGVLRNPERYRCAASWAGVSDFPKQLAYDRQYFTRKAARRWNAKVRGDEDFDLKSVSPARLGSDLSRPVLLAHGTRDSTVPFDQYERMVKAARKASVPLETLVLEGEGHSFSKPANHQKWFDALDAFLAKHNPADQVDETGKLKPIAANQTAN